jgi:hypothetical protein
VRPHLLLGQEEAAGGAAGRLPGGPGLRRALKLLERMAAQNTQRDVIMDFKVGKGLLRRMHDSLHAADLVRAASAG